MAIWIAIILGIIQGVFMFFPVSSTSHLALAGPVTLLGGLFGGNTETPDFQVGFRLEVISDLLEMDFTYGNSFGTQSSGLGFTVGLAYTPSPFR